MKDLHMHMAIPIHPPLHLTNNSPVYDNTYFFTKEYNWSYYTLPDGDYIGRDFHSDYYFFTHTRCHNLTDLKYGRQVHSLSYFVDVKLPLQEKLRHLDLQPNMDDFDKAYAHISTVVNNVLDNPLFQLRLACNDGEDDPQLVSQTNYLKNIYNYEETRFIAGVETHSFATVTENTHYFNEIHLKEVAFLYLQLYVLVHKYNVVPSMQMMPRLLCNLWNSVRIGETHFNSQLFHTLKISKQ